MNDAMEYMIMNSQEQADYLIQELNENCNTDFSFADRLQALEDILDENSIFWEDILEFDQNRILKFLNS